MRNFTDFVDKMLDYHGAQQQYNIGTANNAWFNEFYDEPSRNSMIDKLANVFDCGSRSALKEMLDFQSQIARAKHIREKKRIDFYAAQATRLEGVQARLENKKIKLSDLII